MLEKVSLSVLTMDRGYVGGGGLQLFFSWGSLIWDCVPKRFVTRFELLSWFLVGKSFCWV